jgi:hypothetical protein
LAAERVGGEIDLWDFSPIKGIVEYSDSERVWAARFEANDLRDNDMESASEP